MARTRESMVSERLNGVGWTYLGVAILRRFVSCWVQVGCTCNSSYGSQLHVGFDLVSFPDLLQGEKVPQLC